MTTTLTLIGGPTALIDFEGLVILTDPTFDPPGEYPIPGGVLVKESGPALSIEDLPTVDLVALSHAHHPDNLDTSGAAFLPRARHVVGAPFAKESVGSLIALDTWESASVTASNGEEFTVTAVPARHGPVGCEEFTGIVTGFIIEAPSSQVLYISGDNAAVELTDEIAARFPGVDTAVLFTGAARVGLFDNAPLTLTASMAAEVAKKFAKAKIFPVHSEGWKHFSEDREELRLAFDSAGIANRLTLVEPGMSALLD